MNVLILGSGGREHALAWKISQSKQCGQLFVAPGNGGTQSIAQNISVNPTDLEAIKQTVAEHDIKLVIVGPEAPLVEGIVDYFIADETLLNIPILGPDKMASLLEGSKSFAKTFMQKNNIPTAGYHTVTDISEGHRVLETMQPPFVLKADGLAAGKGVLIIEDLQEAKDALGQMLDGQFGSASKKVVIEEFLDGIEFSVFALTDGERYVLLPSAKDYKRIGEGDTGLNTGGMGSVSPVPFVTEEISAQVTSKIIQPTIDGLKKESFRYRGFVFFGLILCKDGQVRVIEYNCRMGDPETQSVMVRLDEDFLSLCLEAANGVLKQRSLTYHDACVTTVVSVSGGYPGSYEKGHGITLPEGKVENAHIFHAGTTYDGGKLVTSGGRVLAVTVLADSPEASIEKARELTDKITFKNRNYRRDIGLDLL